MESCYTTEPVCASVEVDVLSDHESYGSFARFAEEAPGQTTSKFDVLRIDARGPEGEISVELRQRGVPGVTLSVEPEDGTASAWAETALARVAAAVNRGAIHWRWAKKVPVLGERVNYRPDAGRGDGHADALLTRNRRRGRAMWAWTSSVAALVFAAVYAGVRPAWDANVGEVVWVTAGILLLSGLIGLIPPVRNAVLPPIDIEEKTPGRRVAARAGLLAAPLAALLVRRIFEA
jgi:hypothetical protein